jgi:acetyltransferase-like isoleucine patch superfamily enzyme
MVRTCLLWFAVVLPPALKRLYYRRVFGWTIGQGTRIGLSFLDAKQVTIGDNVHIGHLNFFKNVQSLELGNGTWISNLNTFSGSWNHDDNWVCSIKTGKWCMIMSRHLFDVAGGIEMGDQVTIAGRDSHLWTHTLVFENGQTKLAAKPLRLGNSCYIGARATLLYCELPSGTIVGAGSVVTKSFEPLAGRILMLAGNPAILKREYSTVTSPTDNDPR